MLLSIALVTAVYVLGAIASPVQLTKRSVSQDVYDNLVFYFKYASSAYSDTCAKPNGNTLVTEVRQLLCSDYNKPIYTLLSYSLMIRPRTLKVMLLVMTRASKS